MTRAVVYCRVSTDKQVESGLSLTSQLAKCKAYAALYNIEIVYHIEEGASASTLKRDGLQDVLRYLEEGKADAILVAKLDRLTRSVTDLGDLIKDYFNLESDYKLLSVEDQVDTRTATGRMILNVLMSVSQWEREVISERTRAALAERKKQNKRVGEIPYGYTVYEGVMIRAPDEQEVLTKILWLHSNDHSYRKIARYLNTMGIPARPQTGKKEPGKWHGSTVRKLVKRMNGENDG